MEKSFLFQNVGFFRCFHGGFCVDWGLAVLEEPLELVRTHLESRQTNIMIMKACNLNVCFPQKFELKCSCTQLFFMYIDSCFRRWVNCMASSMFSVNGSLRQHGFSLSNFYLKLLEMHSRILYFCDYTMLCEFDLMIGNG